MTFAQQERIISELCQVRPYSRVKIELDEHGYWWCYMWSGQQLIAGVGLTLPQALGAIAGAVHRVFGDEA